MPASFAIRLAGVVVEVQALHESTERFCADYLVEGPSLADEHVAITQRDIDAERVHSAQHDERMGRFVRNHSDAYLETLALYRKIADVMIHHDAVVFHGCVLAVDGRAYVLTAPSGTGKTTHARFWLSQVDGVYVLNGDKPLLRMRDGIAYACGTPWRGKEHLGCNEDLPIAGICLLERGERAHIEPVSFSEAVAVLIGQTHRLRDAQALVRCIELVGELGSCVPLFRMACTLDESCARMSYEAMAGASR